MTSLSGRGAKEGGCAHPTIKALIAEAKAPPGFSLGSALYDEDEEDNRGACGALLKSVSFSGRR
jgi:hypothetical protein